MSEFEDLMEGAGFDPPPPPEVFDFEVHLISEDEPIRVPKSRVTFDGEELVLTGDTGSFTSFRWELVEYYTGKAVR
ncbi:Uncharacterised protein [Mycobacteroides abscessus subsp. bolletii]|nr:Uncharacterised protein [Mycobacteroides abscessus subsp. bolletii]SKT76172.1 Uncharacterised protein [Mycobacteroides abscessus subsp. bolletii]SLD34814.1 Uncharacterised protein [Mycobacteroides abscessus subsp. bolletii]SLF79975.1 Uncharacterised protein [Mycobacteroides abscessus subsp. bolletii]